MFQRKIVSILQIRSPNNKLIRFLKTAVTSALHCSILTAIDQGVVHVMGPELGLTHPGKTIVCGDSHTSTHGAFGALGFRYWYE